MMPDIDNAIYELGLHETLDIGEYKAVMRVPGGWIYFDYSMDSNRTETAAFVPFHNEFQRVIKKALDE